MMSRGSGSFVGEARPSSLGKVGSPSNAIFATVRPPYGSAAHADQAEHEPNAEAEAANPHWPLLRPREQWARARREQASTMDSSCERHSLLARR